MTSLSLELKERLHLLDMASKVDIVLTNVPRSEDISDVYLGENGTLKNPKAGLIAVETSTTDIPSKLKLAEECSKRGVGLLVAMLGLTVPQAERGERLSLSVVLRNSLRILMFKIIHGSFVR